MPTIILTIQQLYDRVWHEPIHRISKEFGFQIVGWVRWADGKKQRVEECLNEFVEGLITAALIDKQHREEREEEQRRWEERDRLPREEETRIKQLDDWMTRYKRAEEIRRFV